MEQSNLTFQQVNTIIENEEYPYDISGQLIDSLSETYSSNGDMKTGCWLATNSTENTIFNDPRMIELLNCIDKEHRIKCQEYRRVIHDWMEKICNDAKSREIDDVVGRVDDIPIDRLTYTQNEDSKRYYELMTRTKVQHDLDEQQIKEKSCI
jgi:hypothetical protein